MGELAGDEGPPVVGQASLRRDQVIDELVQMQTRSRQAVERPRHEGGAHLELRGHLAHGLLGEYQGVGKRERSEPSEVEFVLPWTGLVMAGDDFDAVVTELIGC